MNKDFDFGFTAVDEDELEAVQQTQASAENVKARASKLEGKVDKLSGLKENVIVGRLVPAGTGSIKNNWNRKALNDDNKFLSDQEKLDTSETQVNQ